MQAYLEGNVFVSEANLKFLLSILVLGWPFCVVFPVPPVSYRAANPSGVRTNFRISLDLIIRLISSMTRELTHTVIVGRLTV